MFLAILYITVFLVCLAARAKVRSRNVRQVVLLAGSYAVYVAWGPWFAAVLLLSTVMNFLLGRMLRRNATRLGLGAGIVLNLALLSSFKYLPPLALNFPFASLQRFAHLALPLGISFWTFQAMSYLFDLYRGEELDPTFVEFALYMVFFPSRDLRADLPPAGDASAISFRPTYRLGRFRAWARACSHGCTNDATGKIAEPGNPLR